MWAQRCPAKIFKNDPTVGLHCLQVYGLTMFDGDFETYFDAGAAILGEGALCG